MSMTKYLLMAEFGKSTVDLEEICDAYLDMGFRKAMEAFNNGTLPVAAFRLRDSQKAKVKVCIEDLARLIDERRAQAEAERAEARADLSAMGIGFGGES